MTANPLLQPRHLLSISARGNRFAVCGLWFVVCGLWFVVYGLWFMVYGLWFVVYGLWFVVCGLMIVVWGLALTTQQRIGIHKLSLDVDGPQGLGLGVWGLGFRV